MGFKGTICLILFTCCACLDSWGKHIVGGDFSMSALPTRGRYALTLNLYNDNISADPSTYESSIKVYIFRKSDNRSMTPGGVDMARRSISNVVYDNAACAESRQLKTSEIRYTTEISLNPNVYNDPQGYYIIWERCCRNDVITNIQNPGGTGIVCMLEFPAIIQAGAGFRNSSPDIKFPNGDYICINRPFSFDMGATDADGDELRYSLITPLAGNTSPSNPMGSGMSRSLYPEVRWAAGFGLANFIPGSRLPAISKQGLITLTANQSGLYVFAVLVEEFRNGVKIGSVRREFQLPVVDCGRVVPPPPSIFENDTTKAIRNVNFCEGSATEISTLTDPTLSYQWKKDGANLPNEKSAKLKVTQPGDYQVVVSLAKTCSNDTTSYIVKVAAIKGPDARLIPTDTLRLCGGDTASIQATASPNFRYAWFKESVLLAGESRNNLRLTQAGFYTVQVIDNQQLLACATRDTVLAIVVTKPVARITASKNNFCPGDSVQLSSDWPPGQTGLWFKDNVPQIPIGKAISVKQAGAYQIEITNGQCSTLSSPVLLRQNQAVTINFDSLRPVCLEEQPLVALNATPTGGVFDGKGVERVVFNVKSAGVGVHSIRYSLTNAEGCTSQQTRYLRVEASPAVRLRTSTTVARGESTLLAPKLDSLEVTRYEWAPPTGLSNANVRNPTATVSQTTTYTLVVTSANGCKSMAFTTLLIADFLFIPDAFSPNEDKINDRWELLKTEQYPAFEVYIYNRWGELVFYESQGQQNFWDGTYKGLKVPSGVYSYVIKPAASTEGTFKPRSGAVWVLH